MEDSHMYLQPDEELKNEEDPVIKEMLDNWGVGGGQNYNEDDRAQTVHGKRNKR